VSERSNCLLFFLLIISVVWSALMQAPIARGLGEPSDWSCYSTGKILDIELARSAHCFESVVDRGNHPHEVKNSEPFRTNTYMDFAFILLYWAIFVLLARRLANQWSKWVILCISVSAAFDLLENWRILRCLDELDRVQQVEGILPWPFSLTKWMFLALSMGFAGVSVWLAATGWRRLLSPVLIVAGLLAAVAAFLQEFAAYAAVTFVMAFVLLIAWFWPYSKDQVLRGIEYGYLLRFQGMSALILALGLPAAYVFIPTLFRGLFDGRGFWSFAFIVWAAFQLAWSIMVTFRLVLVYGPDRFDLTRPWSDNSPKSEQCADRDGKPTELRGEVPRAKPVGSGTVLGFALLAVPLIGFLFYGTASPEWYWKVLAALLGFAAAFGVLVMTAHLQFFVEEPDGSTSESVFPVFGSLTRRGPSDRTWFWRICARLLCHLPSDLTKGILKNGKLRSGHEMSTIVLGVFLLIYLIVGGAFSPAHTSPDGQPAALFFLLSLVTVFTWFLSGAAFFLDRIRFPVWTTLLAVSLITGSLRMKSFGTDHVYITPPSSYGTADEIRPFDVIQRWKTGLRYNKQKTITVVATAGGGIRAAAWTAEVITRLQEHCKDKLSSTVLLVSSVSGGSVGSMFAVDPYDSKTGTYPTNDTALEQIRQNSSRSSLGAVGWGLAYPDLARTTPIVGPWIVPEKLDRGWALEHAWSAAWKDQEQPLMSDWRADVLAGTRPSVIFNATTSESGERFLVSSSEALPLSGTAGTRQFFNLFPESDISVPTAARLSATFPYVSPLSRPSIAEIKKAYHVGDGGYYDNSGLLSVVEWLSDAGKSLEGLEVLLIVIDARPGDIAPGSAWSWQQQIIGPLETLLHVRTSSQQLRDDLELKMAVRYLKNLDQESKEHEKISITVTPAQFLFATKTPAPLSWHLTKSQLSEISDSWELYNAESKTVVFQKLGCDCTPTTGKK
jgi:Patatin-like phospholipase